MSWLILKSKLQCGCDPHSCHVIIILWSCDFLWVLVKSCGFHGYGHVIPMFGYVTCRQYMEAMKTAHKSAPQKSMIFFKLFCYVHPENVPNDSLEASFMFEQVSIGSSNRIATVASSVTLTSVAVLHGRQVTISLWLGFRSPMRPWSNSGPFACSS